MSSGDYFEFSIAHDRKYTLDHLWVQVLDDDEDDMTVKLGISEFIRAELGIFYVSFSQNQRTIANSRLIQTKENRKTMMTPLLRLYPGAMS